MRKWRDRGERKKEKGLEENCGRIHLNSQKAKIKNIGNAHRTEKWNSKSLREKEAGNKIIEGK